MMLDIKQIRVIFLFKFKMGCKAAETTHKINTFGPGTANEPTGMHETSARTWCSGRTWRERVEREVGGGIGMGKTCKLKDVSFQCMTKFTTN